MPVIEPAHASSERNPEHRFLIVVLATVALAFTAGYGVGFHRSETKDSQESRRQLMEYLRAGEEMGYISVDQQKLEEIIVSSESRWEDDEPGGRHD